MSFLLAFVFTFIAAAHDSVNFLLFQGAEDSQVEFLPLELSYQVNLQNQSLVLGGRNLRAFSTTPTVAEGRGQLFMQLTLPVQAIPVQSLSLVDAGGRSVITQAIKSRQRSVRIPLPLENLGFLQSTPYFQFCAHSRTKATHIQNCGLRYQLKRGSAQWQIVPFDLTSANLKSRIEVNDSEVSPQGVFYFSPGQASILFRVFFEQGQFLSLDLNRPNYQIAKADILPQRQVVQIEGLGGRVGKQIGRWKLSVATRSPRFRWLDDLGILYQQEMVIRANEKNTFFARSRSGAPFPTETYKSHIALDLTIPPGIEAVAGPASQVEVLEAESIRWTLTDLPVDRESRRELTLKRGQTAETTAWAVRRWRNWDLVAQLGAPLWLNAKGSYFWSGFRFWNEARLQSQWIRWRDLRPLQQMDLTLWTNLSPAIFRKDNRLAFGLGYEYLRTRDNGEAGLQLALFHDHRTGWLWSTPQQTTARLTAFSSGPRWFEGELRWEIKKVKVGPILKTDGKDWNAGLLWSFPIED